MNSSWTIPFPHSVSVEEIRVFQACTCVNKWTSSMFREPRRMENLSVCFVPRLTLVERPSSLLWSVVLRAVALSCAVAHCFLCLW